MLVTPQLLLVGDDLLLLQTRKMILGSKFSVSVSARVSEACKFIQREHVDLLVVCRPSGNWEQFADVVSHESGRPRIVAVTETEHDAPEWAEAVVDTTKGPYELLKVCAGMFGMTQKSKAHGFSDRSFKK